MKALKTILYVMSFLLLFVACGDVNNKDLQGEIIIESSVKQSKNAGVEIIRLSDGEKIEILKDKSFTYVEYSNERNKLLLSMDYYTEKDQTVIYEYDLITKKIIPMVRIKPQEGEEGYMEGLIGRDPSEFTDVRYIPHKNEISYKYGDSLYIYDIEKKQERKLLFFSSVYSWDKNGESFIYHDYTDESNGSWIFSYDVCNNKIVRLFKGAYPEYSNNNEYIAYLKVKNKKHILTVREIKTSKEWELVNNEAYSGYRFSPDDKFIAFGEANNSSINPYKFNIQVWDFKNGGTEKIINGYYGFINFDWKNTNFNFE